MRQNSWKHFQVNGVHEPQVGISMAKVPRIQQRDGPDAHV